MDRSVPRSPVVDKVLSHYGVKGMKWGVRRDDPSGGGTQVKLKPVLGNRVVVAAGGKKRPLSDDAIDAAVSRQRAKKSNVRSLSNKELKALVERMNLEEQYRSLEAKRLKRGAAIVENIINVGKAVVGVVK